MASETRYEKIDTETGNVSQLPEDHPFVKQSKELEKELGPHRQCTLCGREVRTRNDGTFYPHYFIEDNYHWQCDGVLKILRNPTKERIERMLKIEAFLGVVPGRNP